MERLLKLVNPKTATILDKALCGQDLQAGEACYLFGVDGLDFYALLMAADELRTRTVGDAVTFVSNRNINFTNFCMGSCLFCGFRRNPSAQDGYMLSLNEILRKAAEAKEMGASEVCIQGGLNPQVPPDLYINICEKIKKTLPQMHIHAFSPAEILFAAQKKGCSVQEFLITLKDAGLGSMPGTAAEILDDAVRKIICTQKISVEKWVEVITTAHRLSIPTSATMMYGHIEHPAQRAQHLALIREIQKNTNGFTEFVPLSFIHANTQLYKKGLCKGGAAGKDDLKVHAIARLMLNGYINNIQVSWVKLGSKMAQLCLEAGGNDLGGTLIEENISRSAGSASPSKMSSSEMKELIRQIGRVPVCRSTLYEHLEVFQV